MSKSILLSLMMVGSIVMVGHSEPITLPAPGSKLLNVRVFIEGAFDAETGIMNSLLRAAGAIPLAQPYFTAPWNYAGAESVAEIPEGIVDWILVELRDAGSAAIAIPATRLDGWPRAFFLRSDGQIVDLDGKSLPDFGDPTVVHGLYVVIRHRNHLPVLSAEGAILAGDSYNYDFTAGLTRVYGGSDGYKMIGGIAVMAAGDADHDGNILASDFQNWSGDFGKTPGYFTSDLDLDRNVFVSDYNRWAVNLGLVSVSNGGDFRLTDLRDSHIYKYVVIGNQAWMAENLAYLPAVSSSFSRSETSPLYYVYGYDGTNIAVAAATANYATYGVLYNWNAAMISCPSGWHLPTHAEWTTLTSFLGGSASGKMKEAGNAHWMSPNTGATNSSGFTSLPGGYLVYNDHKFYDMGKHAPYWTSTPNGTLHAWYTNLSYLYEEVDYYNYYKSHGFAVRCVKGQVN